jgi:hypothetical protein
MRKHDERIFLVSRTEDFVSMPELHPAGFKSLQTATTVFVNRPFHFQQVFRRQADGRS